MSGQFDRAPADRNDATLFEKVSGSYLAVLVQVCSGTRHVFRRFAYYTATIPSLYFSNGVASGPRSTMSQR